MYFNLKTCLRVPKLWIWVLSGWGRCLNMSAHVNGGPSGRGGKSCATCQPSWQKIITKIVVWQKIFGGNHAIFCWFCIYTKTFPQENVIGPIKNIITENCWAGTISLIILVWKCFCTACLMFSVTHIIILNDFNRFAKKIFSVTWHSLKYIYWY